MPSTKVNIYFRADGNSKIGLGHIFRCLAVAEMIYAHYSCYFLIKEPGEHVRKMILPFAKVIELNIDISLEDEIRALSHYVTLNDILVIDSYLLDSNYQANAIKKVKKLIAIDDEALFHFYADIVINHASPLMAQYYSKEPKTKILAGPKYLIAREAFRKSATNQRSVHEIKSLFICMGGADPFNITCKVLDAAKKSLFNHIVVVTGIAYKHAEVLLKLCDLDHIEWKPNLSADEIVNEITKCDVAVCTASTISLEICCVKVGLLTGIVAENQQNIHQCLLDNGCAHTIGDFREATVDEITWQLNRLCDADIVKNQMKQQLLLIDGESGTRILEMINKLANE
jgi:UDP-2,4-diacetamido-2,4,6-trideoxy-beta-L-altropyranose hydrolase